MGKQKGCSDLFLAIMANGHGGLWLELKCPKTLTHKAGVVSQAQLEFLAERKANGYEALVCYGWYEAANAIKNYLGLNISI